MRTPLAANLNWTLVAQFKLTNFGLFASQCGCSFTIQVRPLQVAPFDNFSYDTSLSYSLLTKHIILFLVLQSLETTHRTSSPRKGKQVTQEFV